MSEWRGTVIRKAQEVRRGDRISVDGNWLEVIRVNVTEAPVASQGMSGDLLEFLYLNGKSVLYRPDEDVLVQ
jgi:hypothetical protein